MNCRTRLAPLTLAASPLLALAPHAGAQGPEYNYRHGGHNYGVAFIDSDQGMVTRDGGGALFSTDGGVTWHNAETPDEVRKQLRHVFVLDEESAWTVGVGGWVLETTTRGEGWDLVNVTDPILDREDNPASLYDIWMHSPDVGFAVGERGTLVATSNGWATWTEVALPTSFYYPTSGDPVLNEPGDIYRIRFFNSDDGILSTDNGRVLRTDDGGATWTSGHFSGYCGWSAHGDLEFWGMDFAGSEGWLVGGNGTNNGHVFYSEDSGHSWAQVSHLVPLDAGLVGGIANSNGGWPTFYGVTALGNGNAVIAGYGSTIFEYSASGSGSADAIDRCHPLEPMEPTAQPAIVLVSPPMFTGTEAPPGFPPLTAAYSLGANERWITGTFGAIRQWDNTLSTWIESGSAAQYRFYAADFIDATTGFIGASGHRILKTEDAGATFEVMHIGEDNGDLIVQVALSRKPASQLGIALANDGLLLRSADSGDTWQSNVPVHTNVRSLAFGGATDIVYVGGDSGTVFRTDLSSLTSGDLTWSSCFLPNPNFAVHGLAFVDEDTGYAVTAGMEVYETSDGGSQWTQVSVTGAPNTQALRAVATFGDGSQAVAVGAAGRVIVRRGTSFQTIDLSSLIGTATLNDVVVTGGGTQVVAVGNDGVIAQFDGSSFADITTLGNWSTPKSSTDDPLIAVNFDAVDHGFVVGFMGLVVEYD